MKFLRLTVVLASISGLLLISSCGGGGGEETPIEKTNLKLLSKTWTLTSATFGTTNGNKTTEYQNMTITITGTFNSTPGTSYNYSVTGLPVGTGVKTPWPRTTGSSSASGTWRFDADEPASLLYREDGGVAGDLPVTYSVTKDKLQLSFNFVGTGYRTSAVEGQWKFEFAP